MLMGERKNLVIFTVVFLTLIAAQAYYWQSRAIPQPQEDGQPPMGEQQLKAATAGGKPFIRFFYTNGCNFSKNAFSTIEKLEGKYTVERINAAKYCWSGKNIPDCPQMVPAFVIYSNGEKLTIYGNRSADFIETVITQGKAAIAGELNG